MEHNLENNSSQVENNDSFNLREEFTKYLINWKWFVLAVVLSMSSAYIFLRYQTYIYEVSTTVLIKEEENSIQSELAAFQDMAMFDGISNNIENEIQILKSRTLAESVVEDLNLNISYIVDGRVKVSEIYSPFIELVPLGDKTIKKDSLLIIQLNQDKSISFLNDLEEVVGKTYLNEVFTIHQKPYKFLMKSDDFKGNKVLNIHVTSVENSVNRLLNGVAVKAVNKKASVLKLTYIDPIKQRAIDILNQMVLNYQKHEIEDKNKVSQNTTDFVSERLEIIKAELSAIDKTVEDFMYDNHLTNIKNQSELFNQSISVSEERLFELETEEKLAVNIQDYLENNSTSFKLIPVISFSDASINSLIQHFNELLLSRNRVLESSSLQNPLVVNYDKQLIEIRKNIYSSIENLLETIAIKLKASRKKDKGLQHKKSTIPSKERAYKDLERQRSVKEALYLYLLEKQEETQINLAVTTSNSRVIDTAYGSNNPIAPKKKVIILGAFIIGLIVPFVIIYILDLFDNKFHSRKDVESIVKAPILGDIPLKTSDEHIIVTRKSRTSTAEAFRLLRTNLDFMLSGIQNSHKTIMITSTVSGEGKSFVTLNLAIALGLSGKKVALLELDLRAPKIPKYLNVQNKKGVTNYILDNTLKIADISFTLEGDNSNVSIVTSGIKPPNPAELLMHERVDELFGELQQNYDYVIVDTPPVNLVTDTLLLSHRADMFIYLTRANYIDKRLLEVPQNLYKEKRLPNMAVLINGSDFKKGYGYGYGYGRYGGYGYGYGYGETEPKKWWQRFFS